MKNFEIRRNEQENGIELYFSCKPSESVRDALKGAGFRWHGVKKCWYSGRVDAQTAEKLIEGSGIGETETAEAPKKETNGSKLESLWNRCSVADLPAYGTDNDLKKPLMQAGKSYDKAVAEFVRKHLRKRFPECVFSVRSGGAGYLDAVRVSLKSCPYGRQLVKGDPEAQRDRDRWDHWENSAELDAVLNYCQKLLEAFDADDGDYYADYGAHHDLYFTVEVYSSDFTQTAATADILADIEDFRKCKAEAEAREEKEQRERWKKEKEERQEREKMAQIAEEKQRRECAEVEQAAIVEDLPEEKRATVKALNKDLIQRANVASFGGNRGNLSKTGYEGYAEKILGWPISEEKKQKLLDKLYEKWSAILSQEAQHVSVMVAGPAKYDSRRLDHSDQILRLSSEFLEWFKDLESQIEQSQQKNGKAEHLIRMVEFCKQSDNPCDPTSHLSELAIYDQQSFVKYYDELYPTYKWRKNSTIVKLYNLAKEGKLVEVKKEAFFEDANLTAFTEGDRVYIKFTMRPKRQLIVALKSRGYWWNSEKNAWSTYPARLDREWVESISSRYGQYI